MKISHISHVSVSLFKLYIQAVNFTIILMNLGKKGDVVFCNALVQHLRYGSSDTL